MPDRRGGEARIIQAQAQARVQAQAGVRHRGKDRLDKYAQTRLG